MQNATMNTSQRAGPKGSWAVGKSWYQIRVSVVINRVGIHLALPALTWQFDRLPPTTSPTTPLYRPSNKARQQEGVPARSFENSAAAITEVLKHRSCSGWSCR